jgi:chemotaxis protein methyltransferase WspC
MHMDTSLDTFKKILKHEIGLDAESIGEATIKKFLGQRMRACKLENIDEYCQLLANDGSELSALLETAVIPETWFFRDTRPFTVMLNHLKLNAHLFQKTPCNILSIPCSTGEEPYSIAMHLLQAGIPENSFKIKAMDISYRALEIAQQGNYGKNSFRGQTCLPYITLYFTPQNDQYTIQSKIRQCVTFGRVNILDNKTLPYNLYFDFILCRNLLIYFDVNSKLEAFRNLHSILKDDGKLFIGHSEFGAVPKNLFTTTGTETAFGLIKFTPAAAPYTNITTNLPDNTYATTNYFTPKTPPVKQKPAFTDFIKTPEINATTTDSIDTAGSTENLLEQAQLLADQGNLKKAEEYCLRYMDEKGEHADTLFLLALIKESAGQRKTAESFYRKALYLDPRHYQSLIHLSLLLEQTGDRKAANLLRQRAERAEKK